MNKDQQTEMLKSTQTIVKWKDEQVLEAYQQGVKDLAESLHKHWSQVTLESGHIHRVFFDETIDDCVADLIKE